MNPVVAIRGIHAARKVGCFGDRSPAVELPQLHYMGARMPSVRYRGRLIDELVGALLAQTGLDSGFESACVSLYFVGQEVSHVLNRYVNGGRS
jgi:hypothetical protein